jgi:hypothetical protein
MRGMMALLIQYFKKGWAVVTKNRTLRACKINVTIFQLIRKIPSANPTMAVLKKLTCP